MALPPVCRRTWWSCSAWIWAAWRRLLQCTEREVSICAKGLRRPYDYAVTTALVESPRQPGRLRRGRTPTTAATPEAALSAEARRAPRADRRGVRLPGYERSHVEGVENTLKLLWQYTTK